MNNVRLEVRLLAHSIDACTLSAARRRTRRRNHGFAPAICVLLLALTGVVFGSGML